MRRRVCAAEASAALLDPLFHGTQHRAQVARVIPGHGQNVFGQGVGRVFLVARVAVRDQGGHDVVNRTGEEVQHLRAGHAGGGLAGGVAAQGHQGGGHARVGYGLNGVFVLHMGDFMRKDGRQLPFIGSQRHHAPGNENESVGRGKGVDLAGVEQQEVIAAISVRLI